MSSSGEIRIWTEGDKAFAKVEAFAKSGPILLQASAPLAVVREHVARALARRGISTASARDALEALVDRAARRLALQRLVQIAPPAFEPGGVVSQIAARELAARQAVRPDVAEAHLPPGARAIVPDEVIPPKSTVSGGLWTLLLGAVQVPVSKNHLKAGLKFLAKPDARSKAIKIAALAATGNPKAQLALAAISAASSVQQAAKKGGKPAAAATAAALTKPTETIAAVNRSRANFVVRLFRNWHGGVA